MDFNMGVLDEVGLPSGETDALHWKVETLSPGAEPGICRVGVELILTLFFPN